MTVVRTFFAAGILALSAGGAQAQQASFLSPTDHAQWHAIGRLNTTGVGSRRMCSATLIAPDKVLTAAHCIVSEAGERVDLSRLRFVAGWFRGDYAAVGLVAEAEGYDVFAASTQAGRINVPADTAVLTLSAPLGDVVPLPLARPKLFTDARILGYRWDRPHALSDTGACLARNRPSGEITLTCEATFGNSGGPVLQLQDGEWHVIGVVSAISPGLSHGAPLPREALRAAR